MAGFTEGPWEVVATAEGHVITMGTALGNPFGYECHHEIEYHHELNEDGDEQEKQQYAEAEANAKLIIQAPEMYNALKMVHNACGPSSIWQGETRKFLEAIEQILSELDESFDPQAPLKEMANAND